jgi:hypothetical protein
MTHRNTEFYASRYDTARIRINANPMNTVAIDVAEAKALAAELLAWVAEMEADEEPVAESMKNEATLEQWLYSEWQFVPGAPTRTAEEVRALADEIRIHHPGVKDGTLVAMRLGMA